MSRRRASAERTAARSDRRTPTLLEPIRRPGAAIGTNEQDPMKEYRLASWPELPAQFRHAGHRRILSDMSHRHLTLLQLVGRSGLRRPEVSLFIEFLQAGGHVRCRDAVVE